MPKPTVEWLAGEINQYCKNYEGFYACALVKETLGLWRQSKYYKLLSHWSQMIADHYLEEDE